MSNVGQAATVIVGTAVGFLFGNPGLGFQIGLVAGQFLFPPQLPKQVGPRLQDIQTTVAELGNPIGITYGTFAVPGQVMALSCVEEVERTEKVGGKGGQPAQKIVNFEYYQTIALGLCEGVICGVRRIWENGELKYDVRDQQVDESADEYAARIETSGQYAQGFTLYTGTEIQEPDPDLELIYGEGMVPGFRGVAYIVYPNRQLLESQGLRHPQWRFEVVRGPGERGVTPPTLLEGPLDGFQVDTIAVDWTHNRFFTLDHTGGSAGFEAEGVRAFTLRDNTEYLQRTFADIGIIEPIGHYGNTVGIDGFLYLCYGIDNDNGYIWKLDPTTLDIEASTIMGLFQNQWHTALTQRATLNGVNVDFLISGSILGNHIVVRKCETLVQIGHLGDGREELLFARGPSGGQTAYVYALSYDENDFGTSAAITVRRIKCEATLSLTLEVVHEVDIETLGTIEMTDMDPTWVRMSELNSMAYDISDDTLVFCVRGSPSTGIGGDYTRIFKFDPETMEFVWNVLDTTTFAATFDDSHNLTRLAGNYWVHAYPQTQPGSIVRLDLATGEQTIEDWSDVVPGNQTWTGEEIWDDITGCFISFINSEGPVLLCDSICTEGAITLGEIVADVCQRCDIDETGYDVSELTQEVWGYGVMRSMSGRDAIEALRPIAPFDGVESGLQIKFPVRGRDESKTFVEEELSAHESGGTAPPAVTTDKTQAVELPRIVRLHYIAPSRDYDQGEKLSPSRFSPEVIHETDVNLPVALEDSQVMQIAEYIHSDAWAGRWQHEVYVDVSHIDLEPTDVVLVPIDDRLYRCRIAQIEDSEGGLLRKLTLIRDDDGSYVSTAVAHPPIIPIVTGPTIVSPTGLILLDLPPLREEDDNAGIYAVVHRSNRNYYWNGAIVDRSIDEGVTWGQFAAGAVEGTVGDLDEAVGVGDATTWDTASEILVTLRSGSFESRSLDAVINGANAIAVGVHGRWEIIQFADAELVGTHQWRLTNLLRGRRGTEVYIGTSQADDLVVLLSDGSLMRFLLQTSDINQEYQYRATTLGLYTSGSLTQEFTGQGRALEPWAPCNIHGERDGSGNLTITFSRRARFGSDLTPSGDNLPLSETPEEYEIDIIGDSDLDIVRTIDTTVESATYTAAQQTTDFGSPQATVTVKIYQISAIVGRGLAGEAII